MGLRRVNRHDHIAFKVQGLMRAFDRDGRRGMQGKMYDALFREIQLNLKLFVCAASIALSTSAWAQAGIDPSLAKANAEASTVAPRSPAVSSGNASPEHAAKHRDRNMMGGGQNMSHPNHKKMHAKHVKSGKKAISGNKVRHHKHKKIKKST